MNIKGLKFIFIWSTGSKLICLFILFVNVSLCWSHIRKHCFCGAEMEKNALLNLTCTFSRIGLRVIAVVAMTCLFASLINKCFQLSNLSFYIFGALKILFQGWLDELFCEKNHLTDAKIISNTFVVIQNQMTQMICILRISSICKIYKAYVFPCVKICGSKSSFA